MSNYSHINKKGDPGMVDVSKKTISLRTATAKTIVRLSPEISSTLEKNDFNSPKGPVFQTAIIAGTMAVKKTSELIPLCHPLPISNCHLEIQLNENKDLVIECTVKVLGKTGVEMEALTGCSIAALTIYDMCKAVSHDMEIMETKLIKKSGGKSDFELNL